MDIRIDGKPLSQLSLVEITAALTAIGKHVIERKDPRAQPKCEHVFKYTEGEPTMQCVNCGTHRIQYFVGPAAMLKRPLTSKEFREKYIEGHWPSPKPDETKAIIVTGNPAALKELLSKRGVNCNDPRLIISNGSDDRWRGLARGTLWTWWFVPHDWSPDEMYARFSSHVSLVEIIAWLKGGKL